MGIDNYLICRESKTYMYVGRGVPPIVNVAYLSASFQVELVSFLNCHAGKKLQFVTEHFLDDVPYDWQSWTDSEQHKAFMDDPSTKEYLIAKETLLRLDNNG